MTLARIDFAGGTLRWLGIGNVTANLVAKHPGGIAARPSGRLAAGIVGYRIPEVLTPQEVAISPGDLIVIASDGIAENHLDGIDFAAPTLVLLTRHRGTSG